MKSATFNNDFPIVGIGASAGGLEAIIQVLSKMPSDTGMAFVLVQHLDPTHPSMSVEIISRATALPVEEVRDGIRVEPNRVYVIPPNHNMGIHKGVLNLSARKAIPGQYMTIDFFLRSLAQSEGRRAIGIVLSGTGTDGTMGLWAIKAEGGATYAQDPKSAKYDSMPKNAIAAGVVDVTLRPEDITKELKRIAAHPYLKADEEKPRPKLSPEDDSPPEDPHASEALHKIFDLLRTRTKIDFTDYKHTTVRRRILRRMMVLKARSLREYAGYLRNHEEEVDALYNDILINVTEFFRDPDSFKALAKRVFPSLLKKRPAEAPIRVWVPGCSSGEEAYSIAISLVEFLTKSGKRNPIQIFATDISDQAIRKARIGQYPESAVRHLPKERLKLFFDKVEGGYKIRKSVRDVCLFSRHDVTCDPPFAKLDLISCRNLLIYFAKALQKRVIPIFHYGLHPGGFLWLGKSENLGEFSRLFKLEEKTHKIYSKSRTAAPIAFHFPVRHAREFPETKKKGQVAAKAGDEFQRDADKIILSRFSPPSVVVNADLEVLQFRGRTAPFLEPVTGRPSLNLLKMSLPELLAGLRATIQSVKKENKPAGRRGLEFEANGRRVTVDIEAVPVNPDLPPEFRTYLVLFKERVETAKKGRGKRAEAGKGRDRHSRDKQVQDLLKELSETRDYQQSLIEQYEATQEELTSANEELLSTNEEFQSTNEEVETAKEELQSTNEELVTLNEELQARNADLTTLSSDLNNLLASIEIPVLIVGSDRRIRRFSPKAKGAFNLIPADIGRPVGDIKSNFNLNLDALVSEVAESLDPKEIEIQDVNGRWLRVQIRPYKTVDRKIDGATITLVDIDALKQKERVMKKARIQSDKASLEKDVFLATLSHELRTPLSSILTWAQLIRRGKVDFEQARQGAAVIEQSAKTQSQLIDDLLDISRIIVGKLAMEIKPVDPGSVIRAAIESVRPMADKKSVRIEADLSSESAAIHADSVRLQQIVWNLLTNAIKFSPNNGVVNVELAYVKEPAGHFARIKVADRGKGIPPEFLPHIFNRFSQADGTSTRVHGGLGLGLSIVRSLVELQSGTVTAESAGEGKGSVFTVTFPLLSHQSAITQTGSGIATKRASNSEGETRDQSPKLDGSRILVVDDDESSRGAVSIYLKSFGAEVMTVGSASEALEALPNFKPNVLISDLAMPDEDGYDLIRKVRGLSPDHGGDVVALALSAHTAPEDARRTLAAGFQAHIAKPVEANRLGRAILKAKEEMSPGKTRRKK